VDKKEWLEETPRLGGKTADELLKEEPGCRWPGDLDLGKGAPRRSPEKLHQKRNPLQNRSKGKTSLLMQRRKSKARKLFFLEKEGARGESIKKNQKAIRQAPHLPIFHATGRKKDLAARKKKKTTERRPKVAKLPLKDGKARPSPARNF